jgi:hypothetical protein
VVIARLASCTRAVDLLGRWCCTCAQGNNIWEQQQEQEQQQQQQQQQPPQQEEAEEQQQQQQQLRCAAYNRKKSEGCTWGADGTLLDAGGQKVVDNEEKMVENPLADDAA